MSEILQFTHSSSHWENLESHRAVCVQLDDELLALKTQLANFCPRERVDFGEVLKNDEAAVCDSQLQCDALMVLNTQVLMLILVFKLSHTITVIQPQPHPLFHYIHCILWFIKMFFNCLNINNWRHLHGECKRSISLLQYTLVYNFFTEAGL